METHVQYSFLPRRAVLCLSGEDTRPFLQGLITNDMYKLKPAQALYALMLTPQGKYLYDFFIYQHEASLLLETDAARVQELLKRLTMYKLRSRVEIRLLPQEQCRVCVVFGGLDGDQGISIPAAADFRQTIDPRLPGLGLRLVGNEAAIRQALQAANIKESGAQAYDSWRLACGVPEGGSDLEPERALPLDYSMDALSAVDFKKGCYVGQEVTARMHYRANLRKKIAQVKAVEGMLPAPGSPVLADGRVIGVLRSSQNGVGLALLDGQAWQEATARGDSISAEGVEIRVAAPNWLPA